MNARFEYVFPAIRGVQAGREYFISMCPLRLLPKIFLFDEDELVPELRAQRTLNKNRLPEISNYILKNPDSYVFSAITASVDGEVSFEPIGDVDGERRMGSLHVPMKARFIINDGQHRRAAIELALRERPELADESIAVVFFLDKGLARCQQMFADLNRYAIRPSRSLGVLYDHRDELSQLTRLVVNRFDLFRDTVETERSTLSTRSRKLFTLSAIHSALKELLPPNDTRDLDTKASLAVDYWRDVARNVPEWTQVQKRKTTAGEVRRDFIHSHGIVLQALGIVGRDLLELKKAEREHRLEKLRSMDWLRSNAVLWEGRALIGGRVSKAESNVRLTANAIKRHLGLGLTPDDRRIEDAFERGAKSHA